MLLLAFSINAQNSTWNKIASSNNLAKLDLNTDKIHLFNLNISLLNKAVLSTPLRGSIKKAKSKIINVPGEDGKLEQFNLYETPVFSKELSAKYPDIKSYLGISSDNSGARLRMSISPQGVQTMITYPNKPSVFMQPLSKGSNQYALYKRSDKNNSTDEFECKATNEVHNLLNKTYTTSKIDEGGANNQTLQKFRIAISTSGEYTAYHDDGDPSNGDAVADALAAINTTLSRVNEVFETDMAIGFELVDATQLIYTDTNTDPYSSSGNWISELQNTLTTEIGDTAYDIGHLFSAVGATGYGCIGCVCDDGAKGIGFTSKATPKGDNFDIDYVAHEIGHQMGANHTWAFEDEEEGVSAEPGSGSTIMGYAGVAGSNNIQSHKDVYFHYHSIKQILDNLDTKNCQTTEPITNNPPIVNAGSDYNIPKGTAYILKGEATDSDSEDTLTYCWEQIDSGVSNHLNFGSDLDSGPMNRSLPPSTSSERYIPKLSSVIAGNTTQTNPTLGSDWETVSTVARDLNWALTVRDRSPLSATGAQTSYDTMKITVEDVTPFTVIDPTVWETNSSQIIQWIVGETDNGTINCQNVNILLSTDGGITFPTTIASNTPNDGSYTYVPTTPNTSIIILVEAADNIFYDVSDEFSITLGVDNFGFDNFAVFPNPNKGEFTIKLNSTLSNDINVEVSDLRGRTIYKSTHKDTGDFNEKVRLNNVQSGMYILNVSDGFRKSTRKIIVE